MKNRIFSFPYLLFSTDENVRITTGFCDMKIHQEASADMKSQQVIFETTFLEKRLEAQG